MDLGREGIFSATRRRVNVSLSLCISLGARLTKGTPVQTSQDECAIRLLAREIYFDYIITIKQLNLCTDIIIIVITSARACTCGRYDDQA